MSIEQLKMQTSNLVHRLIGWSKTIQTYKTRSNGCVA